MQNRIRLFIDKLLSLSKKSFYMYDFIYLFFFADSPQRTNPMIFLYLWNSAKVCSYKEESTARIKSYQFCLKSVLPRPLLTRMMPQNMISFLMGKPVTSVSLFMEIGPRYVHLVTLIIYLFLSSYSCAVDDTVQQLPSPVGKSRFSLEAFQFVKQPFVFIHCHVVICNASDLKSRCARGCESGGRVRRELGEQKVYSLAQGPITLDYQNAYEQEDEKNTNDKPAREGNLSKLTTIFTDLMFGNSTSILTDGN